MVTRAAAPKSQRNSTILRCSLDLKSGEPDPRPNRLGRRSLYATTPGWRSPDRSIVRGTGGAATTADWCGYASSAWMRLCYLAGVYSRSAKSRVCEEAPWLHCLVYCVGRGVSLIGTGSIRLSCSAMTTFLKRTRAGADSK